MTASHLETRHHELRKSRLVMVDGYWGFASAPADGAHMAARVQREALANARVMGGRVDRLAAAEPARPLRCAWLLARDG